jgi:ribonuclease P protein component
MKLQTIKKNLDFRKIYQKKRSVSDSLLVCYSAPQSMEWPRVGVSVSKKVGGAVVRNRIKRQIKEILRKNSDALGSGYDIIFVVRVRCSGASFGEIQSSCLKLLKKAIRKGNVKSS